MSLRRAGNIQRRLKEFQQQTVETKLQTKINELEKTNKTKVCQKEHKKVCDEINELKIRIIESERKNSLLKQRLNNALEKIGNLENNPLDINENHDKIKNINNVSLISQNDKLKNENENLENENGKLENLEKDNEDENLEKDNENENLEQDNENDNNEHNKVLPKKKTLNIFAKAKIIVEPERKLIDIVPLIVPEGAVCGVPQIEGIFCINLESCKERRDGMKREFSKNNFNATFTQAIHPRHSEHKRRYTNPRFVDQGWSMSRCYCVNECGHNPRKLRPTEVAISLSHYNIYQRIARSKLKWAMVCEDDLIFCKNFCQIINHVIPKDIWDGKFILLDSDEETKEEVLERKNRLDPEGIDENNRPIIIFLGGKNDNLNLKTNNPGEFELLRMPYGIYSNYCYLINLEGAKMLVKKFFPINRPEDSFKRYWIGKGRLDCYRISPSLIAELSAGTNMPSVYNRWSQNKAPPLKRGFPENEYKKVVEEPAPKEKTRRVITFNKKRSTKVVRGKKR